MHHLIHTTLLFCAASLFALRSVAQEAAAEALLGERFSSAAGGISFRAPAEAKRIKPSAMGRTIVQYYNREERWELIVSRLMFDAPTKLFGVDDPLTVPNESLTNPGIVEQAVTQILRNNSRTQVLRQDPVNIGRQDSAVLVTRFTEGAQTWLRQQALIQANPTLFYSFDLKTPSTWTPGDKPEDEDPTEQTAVEVFHAILDSISLVDQGNITRDLHDRLYKTRALFVSLTNRLQQALQSEQYFRIQRAGKDVGWLFVAEEAADRKGEPGTYVATLSRVISKEGRKDDVASEMFVSRDRRKEEWVTHAVVDDGQLKNHASEVGSSERKNEKFLDKGAKPDPDDPKQPLMRIGEVYTLNVTQTSKSGAAAPVTRDLPPYYVPQAVAHLLPRCVPLDQPKGYVFAVWITADRELVYRYLDVEAERQVTFAGRTQRVIPVRDRVGLEGEPTFHYLTSEGKYLGSETPSEQVSIVASDAQSLSQLWPDARIARPRVLDAPPQRPRTAQ